MKDQQIKELIDKELKVISEQQEIKNALSDHISDEIINYTDTEDFNRLTSNQKQYIINSMIKLSMQYGFKLLKTDLEEDHINFIIKMIVESIFKVAVICIDAGFEKAERIKLMKEETLVTARFALSVLKDESKLSEEEYTKLTKVFR